MDYEKLKKPPNTLVLSNALLNYLKRANIKRGFDAFDQTTLYGSLALYNRLIAGMELTPGYKTMKILYLKAAIDRLTNKIQLATSDIKTVEDKKKLLPKLKQWSDILKELTQAIEELT